MKKGGTKYNIKINPKRPHTPSIPYPTPMTVSVSSATAAPAEDELPPASTGLTAPSIRSGQQRRGFTVKQMVTTKVLSLRWWCYKPTCWSKIPVCEV